MDAMDGRARTVHAVCSLDCPDSCGVLVTVEEGSGRAVSLRGDPAHPVTRGFLCGKVAKFLDRVYSPERMLYPMRRRAGVAKGPVGRGREMEVFERVSWDEALEEVAAKLGRIAAEHGPESVLPYSYAGTIGQLGYGSMDRRFFHRMGASRLDRTICSTAGGEAFASVYGVKLGTRPEDFAHAGMVIAWGANVHGNNIHLWPFIEAARRGGARLVVIDPYRTRTAALADEHIAIHPGTDALLALGMMHVVFREGLEDGGYLAACANGVDELRAHALGDEHRPEAVERGTGVRAEQVVALARAYATCLDRTGRPPVIRLNYGVQRSENGGASARAIAMLPLLVGAWKRRGGGVQLSTSGAFPFNKAALEMPELMLESPLGRPSRVVNMSLLGRALTQPDAGVGGPPVKAVFVYNSNPAAIAPNLNDVLRGLRRDDLFTVVHEQFFTDTTDYADVVLPAPTFLETTDVQGAYGHYFAGISEQAIAPLGEAWSNVRMFGELAQRMGFEEACFAEREDALIDQALRGDHPWFRGVTRERMERERHVALALPENAAGEVLPFSTREWFRTASGRGELVPAPVFCAPAESRGGRAAGGAFPLELLPRKADNFMNTTFANGAVQRRMESRTEDLLEMHEADAMPRGIVTGDVVEVWNGRGSVQLRAHVAAATESRVGPGTVAARLDWAKLARDGRNINVLTSERLTDMGEGPTFYSTLVEVRRAVTTGSAEGMHTLAFV